VATILAVDVVAIDTNATWFLAAATVEQHHAGRPDFRQAIRGAMSGSLQGAFRQAGVSGFMPSGASQMMANQIAPAVKQAMQEAMIVIS